MGNLAVTYQHIADILSFESSYQHLEKKLINPSFDWNSIVIEGSKHFVLPAIYCRLKAKKLLHLLPEELNNYLEEITLLNRNRNEALLKQVLSISQLLDEHHINHTFLKGCALLIADCFEDIAERMIGDIDILISIDQLDYANNLLKKNGYTPLKQTIRNHFFEHQHLPRLKPKYEIAAVELHKKLFVSFENSHVNCEAILSAKKRKSNINIPSLKHLLMHNILNYQINDKGALYNSISFRSVYDTISLLRIYNEDNPWYNKKYFNEYFSYSGLFFDDIKSITNVKPSFYTSFYLFKLKNIKLYKIWNRLLKLTIITPVLLKRVSLFLTNKTYRKAIINDRKRIYTQLKLFFIDF